MRNTVERIPVPTCEAFWSKYALQQRPVVLTNLFAGDPIASINTQALAREVLGTMPIQVKHDYATGVVLPLQTGVRAQSPEKSFISFNEYADVIERDQKTTLVCSEYPTPARLLQLFKLPAICRYPDPKQTLLTNAFIAKGSEDDRTAGNSVICHFDQDHRHVLLYQVFGRKRVVVFPPKSAWKLRSLGHYSTIAFWNLSEAEKQELIDYADGYDVTINPGEAIYMPALVWHYIEYVDNGMSFNLRFQRNKYGFLFSIENFPSADMYLQNVASLFLDEKKGQELEHVVAEVESVFRKPAADRIEKFRQCRALFRKLYTEHVSHRDSPHLVDFEALEEQLAANVMESTGHFLDLSGLRREEGPVPAASAQLTALEGAFKRNSYDSLTRRRVLENWCGVSDVAELTKGHASGLLGYLNSPSAAVAR